MLKQLARLFRSSPAVEAAEAPQPPTLARDCEASGFSIIDWTQRRRSSSFQYAAADPSAISAIAGLDPLRVGGTRVAAERLLRHEFDLLGSGFYKPRDPDRPSSDGYAPIDWYWDPVRQLRFPRGVPHKQWNLLEMRPANADVKYPWELGRCQHWATLAQAFLLTGEDRFAVEIAHQLDDFVEANPTGIGINWTCTMDVGLRAVSWAIAFDLIRQCTALDERFWVRAYEALFDHGVFIRNNLENTYEVTSNHFLSNLLGLQFVGAAFAGLAHGAEWSSFARDSIEHELTVQVLPDGADYESSVPYHRLVAELFLGAVRLSDCQHAPLGEATRQRVRDMIAFLAAVTRPDGLMPQVGDADDGRLHIFEGYGSTTPQDARHLFGPASLMFGEPAWMTLGGAAAAWEAAWWGLTAAVGSVAPDPSHANRLFPNAGIAVARTAGADYLLVTNGIVGTNGFGNHKHNDQLSFEYHREGAPLVVDPGSYVYTSDGAMRNRFRSTASHNTIMIDGVEQNEMRPDWLFRMFETSRAESVRFDDRGDQVEYVGLHHGYERLDGPVTHERIFRFAKATGNLEIVDRLAGRGRHTVRWHFHLAPNVGADVDVNGNVRLTAGEQRWTMHVPHELNAEIHTAHYSPSYGVKVPCLTVDASAEVVLDGERRWTFSISL